MFAKLVARATRFLGRHAGVHLSRVTARPTRGNPASPSCPGLYCLLLTEAELVRRSAQAGLDLPVAQVHAAFRRGELCVGAFLAGRLVAYQWLAFHRAPHVAGLWVEFERGDCYNYRKLVLPAYRGRRIGEVLNEFANRLAAQLGCRRMVALIDLHNHASWQSTRRSGSVTVGYAGYLRCFGRSFAFRSTGARREGFRLKAGPVADLVLRDDAGPAPSYTP